MYLIAGLLIGASKVILKLLDVSLKLSFFSGPILMILLDDKIILFFQFADVLTMTRLVIILLIHPIFVDVVNGLLQLGDSLKVLFFVLFLGLLEIVVFIFVKDLVTFV